jgi:large subunit ribosomal protein L21
METAGEMMYAIIADSGKQYRVEEGQELVIDFREDVANGASITFDRVLCVSGDGGVKIGKPVVAGATVTGKVLSQEVKGEKIYIQKMRRRKNFRRRTGHRQTFTKVQIEKISG